MNEEKKILIGKLLRADNPLLWRLPHQGPGRAGAGGALQVRLEDGLEILRADWQYCHQR
jgi:hypothetical protein